ncbi:hypothetical protein BDW66DRAFT_156752 [Aspergillus desertorum]
MSPVDGPESSQSEADGRWEEKTVLCDQIREIIAALNDIRSQLAEQNKYLDVLTETYVRKPASTHIIFADELGAGDWDAGSGWGDYVDFAQEDEEEEEGAVYEETREGFPREEKNYEDRQQESHERDSREPLVETMLAARMEEAQKQKQRNHSLESTAPSTFYLPLGLVINAHASQASFTTVFIILSLAAYIFATFTLWFLREEDWVKRVIGSWKLAMRMPMRKALEAS